MSQAYSEKGIWEILEMLLKTNTGKGIWEILEILVQTNGTAHQENLTSCISCGEGIFTPPRQWTQ